MMSDTTEHHTDPDHRDASDAPHDWTARDQNTPEADSNRIPVDRSFPGGGVRLPRIKTPGARTGPDVLFTDSAFLREPHEPRDVTTETGYSQYYSNDSLFEPATPTEFEQHKGPFEVLGVLSSASWEEVCRAHRQLVSKLHPDRYVDADDLVREAAERRVRDVNEAFSEIRRQRAHSTH